MSDQIIVRYAEGVDGKFLVRPFHCVAHFVMIV